MREMQLSSGATSLEATSKAAAASLGLEPGQFKWVTGEVRHPMRPQTILPESTTEVDYYTDSVTIYGGAISNKKGDFEFGHVQAIVKEPLPEAKHQAGEHTSPVPYIMRFLTYKHGIITVDTPTKHAPVDQGPVVVEGSGRNPRFRNTTVYDTTTGAVKIKAGELRTDGLGWVDDKTVEIDVSELPEDIVAPRVATLERTINATATLFERVAWKDDPEVAVRIEGSTR